MGKAERCPTNQLSTPSPPFHPLQVLIISYETFRLHAERFKGASACDLLMCDEAHRLKNDATLTNKVSVCAVETASLVRSQLKGA